MSESILITGATGFVGWHLAAESLRRRHKTHLIVRATSDLSRLKKLSGTPQIHVHDGTMAGMLRIMSAAKPAAILHTAALVQASHASENVDDLIKSNVLFSAQLLEAATKNSVRIFVNTGTFWQHYQGADYDPVCLYAATKQSFEAILQYYVNINAIRAMTLVLLDTYGSHDSRNKLLNSLVQAAKSGQILPMSPGWQKLNLVDVRDVTKAYFQAIELSKSFSGRNGLTTYAVSGGEDITLRKLVELFNRWSKCPVRIKWGGRPYRDREVMRPWKGVRLPGWRPQVSLEQGLRDYLYDAHLI